MFVPFIFHSPAVTKYLHELSQTFSCLQYLQTARCRGFVVENARYLNKHEHVAVAALKIVFVPLTKNK